ncbi:MAG: FG-GAP-like repeat-containing protein, partial [Anaerolineae bacterium]
MSKKSSLRAAVGLGLAVACLLPAWHPHSLAQETGGPVAGGRLVASGVENPTDGPVGVSADWWAAVQPTIASGTSVSQSVGPDWIYAGDQAEAQLGFVVATAGDVNGDGYADVIVGSRWYSAEGSYRSGRAYLFHGSADGLPTTPTRIIEPPVVNSNGWFGNSVGTAGDVNGDGYDDVIIGMPNYEGGSVAPQDEGAVFVWYGSSSGIAATHDWMAESETLWAHFGMSSGTAGDVNGDGYDDIIVGAFLTSSTNTVSHAYVWYGSDSGLGESGTPANADWYAETITTQAYTGFGSSVGTAGDVNGDGYDDVVVTAPFFDNSYTDEGAVFVWHGSSSGLGGPGTPANADWKVYGGQASARLGGYDSNGANTAGDVNDDGYDDLIAGAYQYDNSETNEGRVYVWHGSALGLSATPDWTAEGEQEGALLGYMVDTAGDVNGDGYDDVVVGAYGYDTDISNAGAALVWYGSLAGLGEDGTPDNADWMATGDQENGYHGWAVATAGDVNGDGLDDVIVGAPTYDNSEADNSGRAYVYHGSSPCRARLNDGPTDYYTVQAAVDASTDPGDVVKVAGTCSGVWARGGLTQTLYLSQTLIVQGGYTTTNWTTADPAAYPTTLDAQGLGRVIYIADADPVIAGLRITGGDADGLGGAGPADAGGGVFVEGGAPTIRDCWIFGNIAETGGGVVLGDTSGALIDNEIYQNSAKDGGGVGTGMASPTVTGNQIHSNSADECGGGLELYRTDGTFANNVVHHNDADWGGGFCLSESAPILTANEILTNTADWGGGGLFLDDSTATVSGNIIRGNQAEREGGGLYLYDSPVALTGNVIRGNGADNGVDAGSGGGLKIEGEGSGGATLTDNEIAENTARWVGAGVFILDSSPTLTGNWIHHNVGNEGSGITADQSEALISGNTIEQNSAQWRGAGITLREGSRCELVANVIRDNDAEWEGGACMTLDSGPTFINNAILENRVNQAGGQGGSGCSIRGSDVAFTHTTWADNEGGNGAALVLADTSVLTMANTIIAGHTTGVLAEAGSAATLDGVLWYDNTDKTGGGGTVTVQH